MSDLKLCFHLFGQIKKWDEYYTNIKGSEYTPSTRKLASDLGVEEKEILSTLTRLKDNELISITITPEGRRAIHVL